MNISHSKPKKQISIISIEITLEDYSSNVEKVLNNYRKKVETPGFRKGKTPMSLIRKKYRTSILVDEINKLLQDNLYKYINENKLQILGSPLPTDVSDINWEKDEIFNFKYEIGFAPEFNVKITAKDKLDYYVIKADADLIKDYSNDIAKRHGKMINPKISKNGDLVFCEISQLDSDGRLMNDGIKNDATVSMDFIKSKTILKKFIGIKKDDEINLNVIKAFPNKHDLAAMLNIKTDQISTLKNEEFKFTVKKVNRLEPAKLNIELFDKVYGKGVIKSKKEFKLKIKKEAEQQFINESDRMLKNDVVIYLVEKLKLKMPDEFLKRWLLKTSEQPLTKEKIDEEFPMYAKSLQWQLIENKILKNFDIKVTDEDVKNHTKMLISMQMKQYGQSNPDLKELDKIAENVLKSKEEKKKIYDQLYDQKTLSIYKEKFKLTKKGISYNDFVKLASNKNKKH